MYKIMTPGPTQVAGNVRMARMKECTNPDLDTSFCEFYKETCELISELLGTKNETLILGGEGILGLEAACASLTEPGDKVLVIDNGLYGNGFKDFVTMYGGVPAMYTVDYKNTINIEDLETNLENNLSVHIVKKKIPYINENGELVKPETENGYKFETLVLDMIHMMDNCLAYEVVREKEFAPIKNKTGVDSLDTAKELLKLNGVEL